MYNLTQKIDNLINNVLDEAEQNIIPEVPEDSKIAGKNIKKEIEGKKSNSDVTESINKILSPISIINKINEHIDNYIPEVPEDSKIAGKNIKKSINNAINPKINQFKPDYELDVKNELPSGVEPDDVDVSLDKMTDDISEEVQFPFKKKDMMK